MYVDPMDLLTMISRITSVILLLISIVVLIYHVYRLYDASYALKPRKARLNGHKSVETIQTVSYNMDHDTPHEEQSDAECINGQSTFGSAVEKLQQIDANRDGLKCTSDQPRVDTSISVTNSSKSQTNPSMDSKPTTPNIPKTGYNICDIFSDLFDKTSHFRIILTPQSMKFSIYLCLATIFVCGRSVAWAFYTVSYMDGLSYQIIITIYIIAKGIHRWIMYWLLLAKVQLIFQRTKYRIRPIQLKRYRIILTITFIFAIIACLAPCWIFGSELYSSKLPRIIAFFAWFVLIEFLPSIFCCYIFVKRIYLHLSSGYQSAETSDKSSTKRSKSSDNVEIVTHNDTDIDIDIDNDDKRNKENDTSDLGSLNDTIPKTLILTLWIVLFTIGFTVIAVFIPDIRIINLILDPIQGIGICVCVLLMYKSHLSTYTQLCLCCHKQIKSRLLF